MVTIDNTVALPKEKTQYWVVLSAKYVQYETNGDGEKKSNVDAFAVDQALRHWPSSSRRQGFVGFCLKGIKQTPANPLRMVLVTDISSTVTTTLPCKVYMTRLTCWMEER